MILLSSLNTPQLFSYASYLNIKNSISSCTNSKIESLVANLEWRQIFPSLRLNKANLRNKIIDSHVNLVCVRVLEVPEVTLNNKVFLEPQLFLPNCFSLQSNTPLIMLEISLQNYSFSPCSIALQNIIPFCCSFSMFIRDETRRMDDFLEESRIRQKSKKRRICKVKIAENEDRPSDLPDGILLYILSSLNTKHAIRTCVLSKRWKHLSKRIPSLILHSSRFSTVKQFKLLCLKF